ncbi:MAG: putative hydrolase of the superfamily, partial [Actinomycetota bacterium]|nr:putative hydrolase of the superfamily [Actinomycetota bacterium]
MRGVLFDVDDTLVDHAEDRHLHRHLTGELTFQEQRRARVRDMLGAADLDDATADAWFAGYTERFEAAWAAYDDVASVLDLLASHDLA